MDELLGQVVKSFGERFSEEPDVIAVAPGRVNLIGEHTDYNGGYVLPVAIDREIVFAVKKGAGNAITGYSIDFNDEVSFTAGKYDPRHPSGWVRYIMGVLNELKLIDVRIEGFTFTLGGNVPIGSGLSSSAALEMAVYTAMEGLMGFHADDMQAALLCQRAENNFVGMNCGIMDQYISRIGRKDHAILIDCRDLSTRAVSINTPGCSWLVIDSKKRRGLVDSEYNKRRSECEEGVRAARSVFPDRAVDNLRDLTHEDLDTMKSVCPETVYRRVKHNVTENDRVVRTVTALQSCDLGTVGECLYTSHASLRDDFEVSCTELDMIVDILAGTGGVIGARLTGAGFGGCVIALVRNEALGDVENALAANYRPASLPDGERAEIWPIRISDGAHLVAGG